MQAKKSLGQNFLTSPTALAKIIAAAELTGEDTVLEVGPGKGVLTEKLLEKAKKVIAVEKDSRLISFLQEKFAGELQNGKLELIEGDILKISPQTLDLSNGDFAVVANIPYYITGEFLRNLLSGVIQPNRAILLLQKEVAERIARSKKESLLSLSVKAYGKPRFVATLRRGAFSPTPAVDSAILSIEHISKTFFDTITEADFFATIRLGFGQKRKQLIANLKTLAPRAELEALFSKLGLISTVRAEDLDLSVWKEIVRALKK